MRPLTLLLLSCARDPGYSTDVVTIRVDPAEVEATVRLGEPAVLDFDAYATFGDGEEQRLSLVSWSASNLSSGAVSTDGVFTSVDTNGGFTEIIANHLGVEGRATVRLVYAEDILAAGADPALPAAFAGASATEADSPALRYPGDGVRVPRNLEGLAFSWTEDPSRTVHRLRFQGEITDISVYVEGDSQYTATATLWERIGAANKDGEVLVTVSSGVWDGSSLTDVQTGPPISLTVNRLDARGSVLYWATANLGVMRIPFGQTTASPFYTAEQAGRCIGCHVVSDPTDRMVISYDGINGQFGILNIADPDLPSLIVNPNPAIRMTFKTLSPDGNFLLGTNNGEVSLYSALDGHFIKVFTDLEGDLTHPDWSPDGGSVVFTHVLGGYLNEFNFEVAELVLYDFVDQALTNRRVLVAAQGNQNNYYPAFSPDGDWVAFNRTVGSNYASAGAELWLVSRDGGPPVRLDVANGAPDSQNSYPRWGPLPDDDVLWLAFSSKRGYPLSTETWPQIWVSAIDVSKAAQGADPSSAPFWLPGQSLTSDNHLPYWWAK